MRRWNFSNSAIPPAINRGPIRAPRLKATAPTHIAPRCGEESDQRHPERVNIVRKVFMAIASSQGEKRMEVIFEFQLRRIHIGDIALVDLCPTRNARLYDVTINVVATKAPTAL